MASKDSTSIEKRARFRFKAEIYDTYKNDSNITFYVINVKIYGLNVDEYEIKKRFSQFAEFDNRLRARFHHKRLPSLPSKTITKSAKHADEFIAKRKIALNRYLRGVGQRLYLQNCEAIWHFFEFINKINPYLHRYRVLHLKSIQCNDYQLINDKKDNIENNINDKQSPPKSSNSGFSFRNLFEKVVSSPSSKSKSANKLSSATSKSGKKILREWKVIYGTFISSSIYLSVSTIHSDNTKNNWWDTFMSTATDAKTLLSNNPITTNDDIDDDNDIDVIEEPNQPINNNNNNNNDDIYNREDRLESVDFDSKSDLNIPDNDKITIDKNTMDKKGLSAWEAEKLAFAQNEFYLGKIEIYKWDENETENDNDNDNDNNTDIIYKSYCRFPLVRNRPSCALFIANDNLLLVGTSHGKILCFKLDIHTHTLSHICYLPRVFGSYVTDMISVSCDEIYYQPSAYELRIDNPLPRGNNKTSSIGNVFIYVVSNDCHLGVFDLRTGDCLGHIQTGVTGNLSITYCCEKFFVSSKSNNNIGVFIRSSATGDPVPQTELIGHTTTVYSLWADNINRRLFSGSGDNSVGVWYYDKLQDTMLQIQQLKSVSKSSQFTCITTANNINCLIAGSDNGFITIWHEYDINCDELSDKMYDLRMLITKKEIEIEIEKKEEIGVIRHIDVSDNVPPSLTQQNEILKQNERKYDISKNNLKNGSISSKKSKTNMIWKCVYTWKAHKGSVTTVRYYEKYNMLLSTSNSGQIRLVYLCDPGCVPPMKMVNCEHYNVIYIKDKLNKIFNEIQEIENNNYPNTQYQNLNLLNEYQNDQNEKIEEIIINTDGKIEEEEEEEIVIKNKQELKKDNKVVDDIWNDENDNKVKEEVEQVEEQQNNNNNNDNDKDNDNDNDNDKDNNNNNNNNDKDNEVPAYEKTSLAELL